MNSLLRFESMIKSEVTKRNYKRDLDLFLKYFGVPDYDSILSMSDDKMQDTVEEYIIHLKNTKNLNSIKVMFFGVKHFLVMNRKRLDWEIVDELHNYKANLTFHPI